MALGMEAMEPRGAAERERRASLRMFLVEYTVLTRSSQTLRIRSYESVAAISVKELRRCLGSLKWWREMVAAARAPRVEVVWVVAPE